MTKIKVFSWNFGKLSNDKLACINRNVFDIIEESTIYVIGLQEVSGFSLNIIKQYFETSKPASHTMAYGIKSSTKDFDLVTFIFYPNNLLTNIRFSSKKIPSKKGFFYSMVDTKGYLWADFTLNNVQYTVANIHLPFQNEAYSLENFQLLKETFKGKDNVIIFGDYNTRSKVDDACMGMDTTCNVNFEKNAKGDTNLLAEQLNNCSKNKLENKGFEDRKSEYYDNTLNTEPLSSTYIDSGINCTNLLQKVINYDYLNESKVFTDYKEDDITFLPTYKINHTGEYSLIKDVKKRLSGYADRILVRGSNLEIVPGSYKKIDCLGNDHFPIMLDVSINQQALVMGGKIKTRRVNKYKRTTSKNRKHKNKSIRKNKSTRKNKRK